MGRKSAVASRQSAFVRASLATCLATGAVAGSANLAMAATPTPPAVPTAPTPPAFQYLSAAGYPEGTVGYLSYGTSGLSNGTVGSFNFVAPQESTVAAGGYLSIRNTAGFREGASSFNPAPPQPPAGAFYYVAPYNSLLVAAAGGFSPTGVYVANTTTEFGWVGGANNSGGGTTIETVQALTGSGPVAIPVLGSATVGEFTVGNGGYPIQISQDITVKSGAASTLGTFDASSGYFAPISLVTGNYAGLFSVGDGGYGWVKLTGTLNTTGKAPSLGTTGVLLSNVGGTYVGAGGGPPFKSPVPPTPGSSGYGPNQVDVDGFITDPAAIYPASQHDLGGPSNGTGYGIVNVAGGTWNNSNGAIQIGFGSQGFVTVDSGGSINLSNSPMIVGQDFPQAGGGGYQYLYSGIGTVVVSDGSITSTGSGGYLILGLSLGKYGSTGRLYITGSGSKASISSGLLVGDGGYGFLAVENGAAVTSASAYAAGGAKTYGVTSQPGSGNIVIDGVSSSWAISGNADFGETGVATVTVQNHGDLNIGGTLTLGDQSTGSGTLTVQADGTVESGDATLGNQAGATGFANVTDTNTFWTVDGDLTLGNSGQGTLTVSNNGMVTTTGDATLGSQTGSAGFATVTDPGSEWQINGELKVGDNGDAAMSVENGGYVSLAGNLEIADSSGTSSLTLDGAGTRMIVGGTSVTIGSKGDGTLTVQNAALAAFSGASVTLGENGTGSGTLTVQGGNTTMSTGSLTIGSQGTGTLNVLDTASLTTATNISLGEQSTGTGTATIDNSSVTDTGTLTIGGYGTGTLTIQDSGSLTVQGNDITLGEQNGGSGTLNLIGSGSALNFTGDMTVGSAGSGDFELQNAAQFGGVSMTVGAGTGFGGASTGGSGTVEISGAGSSLSLEQDLTVGKYGQGTITLAGGGSLIDQGDVTLGSVPASNGTVNVNTGSIWLVNGSLTIGSKGYGTVVVNGGSNLKSTGDSITIGKEGAGELTVSGTNSLLSYTGDITVGDQATGTFNVQSSATVQASGSGSNVYIAETSGINGTLSIDGSGSNLAATNLAIGGTGSKSGGNGSVSLTNGGSLTISKVLTMWKNGNLNTTNGYVTIGTAPQITSNGNIYVAGDGEFSGTGSVTGNLNVTSGTIDVGGAGTGKLDITGNFAQTGGTLKFNIAGTGSGQASQLDATGTVKITNAVMEFDFTNGYAPTKGQQFQVIDPPQSVNLGELSYTYTGLATGFEFNISQNSNGLLFTALNNGVATTSPTPEPASLGLLAIGTIGLLLLKRRKTA